MKKYSSLLLLATTLSMITTAQDNRPVQDIMLSNYAYPFKVNFHHFKSQDKDLKMAYMDVLPPAANGKTVLLMHGKNFNGAYWKTTIDALTKQGY